VYWVLTSFFSGTCYPAMGSFVQIVYFEKIRVFKAGIIGIMNTLAWDNRI
jgi:hypothetical protein